MNAAEKFDSAVAMYLQNLRMGGKSEATVRNYASRLALFREFWTEHADAAPTADPDYAVVLSWRDALLHAGRQPSTVRQYLKELSFFFSAFRKPIFGRELQYPENPVDEEFYPKTEKRPYDVILTDTEVLRLTVNECPLPQLKPMWARNYALTAILLTSQIRNAELLDLRPSDLDFENGELAVERGKGNKYRRVQFTPFAQSAVRLYLASGIRPAALPSDAPLFGTTAAHEFGVCPAKNDGEKWHRGSSQWLSSLIERHVKTVTGVANVRTHDLRHVGSRILLNAGASMEFVQAELGHASFATTQLYCGRLLQRRGQNSARAVLAAMSDEAERNDRLYRLTVPSAAV